MGDVGVVIVASSSVNDTQWRWNARLFGTDRTNAKTGLGSGFNINLSATAPSVQNNLTTTNYANYFVTRTYNGMLATGVGNTYQSQAGMSVPSPRGNTYLVADGSWSLQVGFTPSGSTPSSFFALAPTYLEAQAPQPPLTSLRCDSSTGRSGGSVYAYVKGCVFDDILPTLTLSKSDRQVAESAKFIANTVASKNAPTLLTRNEDQTHERQNRAAASKICATKSSAGVTNPSCDEYPFAASNQGNADNPARSAAAWVPLSENGAAGTRLGQKIKGGRIANQDRFRVAIAN